ncbi:MAG: hypothetical protein LC804_21650, partial [Acidobacteria bacterium]|nr:hypothetical protein [Acidobacteriota bacterium]
TSDNISPRHLLNIKRLAYETNPAPASAGTREIPAVDAALGSRAGLPKAPVPPRAPGGIAAESLARRIDQFLASRGYTPPPAGAPSAPPPPVIPAPAPEKPADFVCEDDVRQAIRHGRKIVIGERSIVTPAARDLGEQHRLFVQAAWPR